MKCLLVAVTVVALVAFMTVDAQVPSCAQNLIGCANYLNATTKPPSSCCDPLEQAVTKQLTCLCNLYNDPGLLASFGINVTQALGLPGLCGIPGNIVACTGATTSLLPNFILLT